MDKDKRFLRRLLMVGVTAGGTAFYQGDGLAQVAQGEPVLTERGAHHCVFERTVVELQADGRTVERKSSYTQLSTGMHYWKDGRWTETNPRFRVFAGGAIADEGPFQLIASADLAQEPVLDFVTPDAKRFQVSPRWLVYHNRRTGQSSLIAAVKSCVGELVAQNVIVYPDAFDTVFASIRVTYEPWGIEHEVVLRESAALRPADWGLNGDPGDIVLEVWSDFHLWPNDGVVTTSVEGGLDDVKLSFGESVIGLGKAFSLGDEEDSMVSVNF